MKAFVGVTDKGWFRYLRTQPHLDEVNFWQPGGNRRFRALQPGEPFLFKLRSPDNFIVAGGLFSRSYLLPVSLAWSAFEHGNGAPGLLKMRRAIESHRDDPASVGEDYRIDIHRLFDRGYVTVDSNRRFRVSRRLRDDFDNGEPGKELWVPPQVDEQPNREFLEWHADTVFRG